MLTRHHRNVNYRSANQNQQSREQYQASVKLHGTHHGPQQQHHHPSNLLKINSNGRFESSITSLVPDSFALAAASASSGVGLTRSQHNLLSRADHTNNIEPDSGFTVPTATTTTRPASSSSSVSLPYEGANNENNGLDQASSMPVGGVAAAAAASLAFENPTISGAMLGSNLVDSYDIDQVSLGSGSGSGGGGGGGAAGNHYDYAYQALPARESHFSISDVEPVSPYATANNSTMALYRLLNFIDPSGAPPPPLPQLVPLSLQNSKATFPYSSSSLRPISTNGDAFGRLASSTLSNGLMANNNHNFDNYYNYHYQTNLTSSRFPLGLNQSGNFNNHHAHSNHHNSHLPQLFANNDNINHRANHLDHDQHRGHHSQYQQKLLNSMPSHHHWSRRRNPGQAATAQQHQQGNQQNWHQQNLSDQAADLNLMNNGLGPATSGPASYQAQQVNKNLFADNMIENQPATMKPAKSSPFSYLNTEPRRSNNYSSSSQQQQHHHHQHHHHRNQLPYHNDLRAARGGGASPAQGSGGVNSNALYNSNNGGSSANSNNFNLYPGGSNSSLRNGIINDDDGGFGNKQPQPTGSGGRANGANSNANANNSEKLSGALTSSASTNSKLPDADSEMIASNNAPRCDKFTPDICVDDFEYPEQAIIDEIQKKRDVFELMYSEVKDNEPLVDGIPRDVEESYNYDYYYYGKTNLSQAASSQASSTAASSSPNQVGAGLRLYTAHSKQTRSTLADNAAGDSDGAGPLVAGASLAPVTATDSEPAASDIDGMDALIGATPQATNVAATTSQQGQQQSSPPSTGYICPSEVMYGKPKLAKNKKGLWKVIVNAGEFTQTVRLEKCLFPNKKCNYVSAQNYESRCAQVHSYHRLLVFEKGRGFYIDTFRLPTGCNCFVSKKHNVAASSQSSSSGPLGSGLSSGDRRGDSSTNDSHQDTTGGGNERPSQSAPANGRAAGSRLPALIGDSSADGTGGGHRPSSQPSSSSSSSRSASSESMLSQTLWSILSGGGASSGNGPGSSLYPGQAQRVTSSPPFVNWNKSPTPSTAYAAGHIPNSFHNEQTAATSDQQAGGNGDHRDQYQPGQGFSAASPSLFDYQRQAGGGFGSAHQSQSLILEHLSMNPSLAANISDSVLRQLIDVGQIGASGSSRGGSGSISLSAYK